MSKMSQVSEIKEMFLKLNAHLFYKSALSALVL